MYGSSDESGAGVREGGGEEIEGFGTILHKIHQSIHQIHELYKGVFKGGGRVQPPPKKKIQIYF